jgi:hypothetical protein
MCSGTDLDIKDSNVHLFHIQLQVPVSILYPKVALPRTLEFYLNHALCLKHQQSVGGGCGLRTLPAVHTQACLNYF